MQAINYNHLYYFWVVARHQSVTVAARELQVSQPTVSAQIRALERTLGEPLFERTGRRMALTDAGRIALRHAQEMFTLGEDLPRAVKSQGAGEPTRLTIGIADAIPKTIVRHLLEPVLRATPGLSAVCVEWRTDILLAELALHRLDLVICDTPVTVRDKTVRHVVGESGMVLCAAPALAAKLRKGFPKSLEGAPMVFPAENSPLREAMDKWFRAKSIRPKIVIEAEDPSLMNHFAENGVGAVPIPNQIEEDTRRKFNLERVGELQGVKQHYYVIGVDRTFKHPAVQAICAGRIPTTSIKAASASRAKG